MRIFLIAALVAVTNLEGVMSMDVNEISEIKSAGIPVIVRSTKTHGDIVSINLVARGGVMLTPQSGALDLLASSLSKGTPSYSKEVIDRMMTETGALFGIETKLDSIEVGLTCLKKFVPVLLPVISEMLRSPNLT